MSTIDQQQSTTRLVDNAQLNKREILLSTVQEFVLSRIAELLA